MERNEQGAKGALPDLPERIDLAVGHLTVMAQSLRTGRPLLVKDADALESAMLLLAGLQAVVSWEPTVRPASIDDVADQLRTMASIGPRPPAVLALIVAAVAHLKVAADAKAEEAALAPREPDQQLVELLLGGERSAYDLAEEAIALGRRLAELGARAGAR